MSTTRLVDTITTPLTTIAIGHEPVTGTTMMTDDERLIRLLDRLRTGDADAARDFVGEHAAEVDRRIRVRLHDQGLRERVDALDVSQSVFADFLRRMSLGAYRIETRRDLAKLLGRLVRNKVADAVRRATAEKRNVRRTRRLEDVGEESALRAHGPTAEEHVELAELVAAFRARMTPDEQWIARLRADGVEWDDVARRLEGTPSAVRMRLERAIRRVLAELELTGAPRVHGKSPDAAP